MPRILYITTELPYFPGQGGLMAFQMRYLAQASEVGVVGPRYLHQPEDALQVMRDTVQRSYWWPEHPAAGGFYDPGELKSIRCDWLRLLPRSLQLILFHRLTGLYRHPPEAFQWRVVLNNLAPKILEALNDRPWNVVLLAQSSSVVWLPFLPASMGRCIYLHDIRSDYLRHSTDALSQRHLRLLRREELDAVQQSDALATVSDLDRDRAIALLGASESTAVAPICLDLEYFELTPARRSDHPCEVLFTGHLSHPPNIDAVGFLTQSIWPQVLAEVPSAKLKIVGLQPSPKVQTLVAQTANAELFSNVSDIRKYFRAARVYVVPMRYGGGVRQKIVEAWAMGVPVVTTQLGAEGLAARDNENCWIRNTAEEFSAQMIQLLQNQPPLAVTVAGRATAEAVHAPSIACPPLFAQINRAATKVRTKSPRILFDLRWLDRGKVGGVEQMAEELIHEIATFDRTLEYRFLGSQPVLSKLKFPRGFRAKFFPVDGYEERLGKWRDSAVEILNQSLELPAVNCRALRALEWYTRMDFTVTHGIPSLVHPELRRFPSVVTVHDLLHIHRPDLFSPADLAIREREYRESCERASRILCPSEFTRKDVHRHFGVPLDRITTIFNLPPRRTATPIETARCRRLLRSMGVSAPFFFFPAQPWLHKNHESLLAAVKLADRRLPADYKVVLTGQPFPPNHPASTWFNDPVVARRAIHLGYRTPEEISALFQTAEAMIFPSLFEGFGIPLIEAMQKSCPIVCGNHSAIPEVVVDAALYTNVTNPAAIAEAMLQIAADRSLRQRLIHRGHTLLPRFDRRKLAEKTRAMYVEVHDEHFA